MFWGSWVARGLTCTRVQLHTDSVTRGLVKWDRVARRFSCTGFRLYRGSVTWGSVVVIIHKFHLNSVVRSPTTPPKDSDPPIPTHVLAKLLCGRYNTQALVYEICEFFAKRYLRKGIAMVKNASRVIKEWNACINNTKNKLRYLIDLTLTRDIARKYSIA